LLQAFSNRSSKTPYNRHLQLITEVSMTQVAPPTAPDFNVALKQLQQKHTYKDAELRCDVVMKGGVTSGIVYPYAICELARTYRFKQIGGTSAGAIAAALTAAAELGRARGQPQGFADFALLPKILAAAGHDQKTFLEKLFQPQPGTRRIFTITTSIVARGLTRSWLKIMFSFSEAFRGLLPGVIIALFALWAPPPYAGVLFVCALWVGISVCLGAFAWSFWKELERIPENNFGFCKGMGNGSKDQNLIQWLSDLLDQYACQGAQTWLNPHNNQNTTIKPLTFGDLEKHDIHLRLMTTCLTHGRPYELPCESKNLYFRRDDLQGYLPQDVIDWMTEHARKGSQSVTEAAFRAHQLIALPEPKDMPVIFAVRLSLSFPVLFSAVPLWARDITRAGQPKRPERVWFSDGGITSNFPVHFFDAPLPGHPTFALNLIGEHPDFNLKSQQQDNVELPVGKTLGQNDGKEEFWTYFRRIPGTQTPLNDTAPSLNLMFTYLTGLVEAARNWQDNTLIRMPGQLERIANIRLASNEGGLNLSMPNATIEQVAERGWWAGYKLAQRFPNLNAPAWKTHRQTRFENTIYAQANWFARLEKLLENDPNAITDLARASTLSTDGQSFLKTIAYQMVTFSKTARVMPGAAEIMDKKFLPEPQMHIRPKL
jgi:predicted acylesterase/phospholipase RssA